MAEHGQKTIGQHVAEFNEALAALGTRVFGSMWTFYLFFCLGIVAMLPSVGDHTRALIQLISSAWIQLWALPLLMVGGVVLNRASEKRAEEDHTVLRKEFDLLKEGQKLLVHELAEAKALRHQTHNMAQLIPELLARLDRIEAALGEKP